MQGLHLTADLYQCGCNLSLLVDAERLSELCRRHTLDVGLTLVDEKWFTFPEYQGQPGGVTGMLLLAESHLAVHTWPERRGVTLDVYVCNFCQDNSAKAERLATALIAAFAPEQTETHRILRGSRIEAGASDELILETLDEHSVYGFRIRERLLTQKTAGNQLLEIFDTPQFGRTMRLDGHFMTSAGEEFFYHEALIHPAAISHPAPRQALIIGGGDGGAAEELLKHPSIERVVIAELDADVVEASKRHLEAVHRGAFADPRLEVRIGDGFAFLDATDERFDLVLFDLTDPDTPAASLYTASSFAKARRALAPGGALVLHIGSPIFHPERVRGIVAELRQVFSTVHCYGLYIPLYGAYWGLAIASDTLDATGLDATTVETRLAERGISDLRYYNGAVHGALFALPNFYRELVR
ncbi:polyamine aminopropyltransferase [Sulfuricystis multivorans]|uniref:polyamine aminopropyltransferase n=1 Tax=Sulfuricystis multivorans TaxID=2211108 RepID=UPI000F83BB05|nr:polyamine aminopropyltransferase [Sulfuricystis multivorans]